MSICLGTKFSGSKKRVLGICVAGLGLSRAGLVWELVLGGVFFFFFLRNPCVFNSLQLKLPSLGPRDGKEAVILMLELHTIQGLFNTALLLYTTKYKHNII